MQQLSHDERVRQLQRLAYGAVASDAERAAAAAELEALRREREVEAETPADASAPVPILSPPSAPVGSAGPVDVPGYDGTAARPLKWAIVAGTAALLVGVAVGWHFGMRMPAAEPVDQALGASASLSVRPAEIVSVPVTGSAAYGVFDRPSSPADTLPVEIPDDWVDPASLRLLATTPDGLAVYGAKALRETGSDVCLIILRPNSSVGASCTVKGMFEHGRLRADHYAEGEGLAAATWHADGSVQIGSRNLTVQTD